MSREANRDPIRIDRFFASPGARADHWSHLVELAEGWSNGSNTRSNFETGLAGMTATEEFHAYPGQVLMTALREHVAADDAHATAVLARRITRALLTRSFRQNAGDWDTHEDGDGATPEALHPALARPDLHRPYF